MPARPSGKREVPKKCTYWWPDSSSSTAPKFVALVVVVIVVVVQLTSLYAGVAFLRIVAHIENAYKWKRVTVSCIF
jgi:hypothetical protein